MHIKIYYTLLTLFFSVPLNAQQSKVVAMHLLNFTTDQSLLQLTKDISTYKSKGINTIILEVDYHFQFKSHPELIQDEAAITFETARKFSEVCKKNGINIVPQFQSLGHQSWAENTWKLLSVYPGLDSTPGAFPNNDSIYCREWDPFNPKVYEIVFPLIDEILDAFQAKSLHIGMDEVFLLGHPKSPSTYGKDNAETYAYVVNKFYEYYTKQKGIQLYMWGDRLLDGKKFNYGEWESSFTGTAPAVDLIPKDIIICDWHYEPLDDYPSVDFLIQKGFKVLPTSYVNPIAAKQLIKSSFVLENDNMLGHLFTSWSAVPNDSLLLYDAFVHGIKLIEEKSFYDPKVIVESIDSEKIILKISKPKEEFIIRYSIDTNEVTTRSMSVDSLLIIYKSLTLKFALFDQVKRVGATVEKQYFIHKGIGAYILNKENFSIKYKPNKGIKTLINGIAGTESFADGEWCGYNNTDVWIELVFDKAVDVNEISFNAFHQPNSWIYGTKLDARIDLYASRDDKNNGKKISLKCKPTMGDKFVVYSCNPQNEKVQVLQLKIPRFIIPEGEVGEGNGAWIFIDELILK